jgi:ComF family protein
MHTALTNLRTNLYHLALELIFPPRCGSCNRLGVYFCADCLTRLAPPPTLRCPRCDQMLDSPLPPRATQCAACRTDFPSLQGLRIFSVYQNELKAAIHALKYNGLPMLAQPLGDKMAADWQARGVAVDGVIPVPLHPERVQQRGYNQSVLLAKVLCEKIGAPLREDVLVRVRPTRPQVGLSRAERLNNVAAAFESHHPLQGGTWLLVDDVCTSGATLEACANALLTAGATAVWAVAAARPLRQEED